MTTYALRLENGTDTAARVRMADLLALPAGAAPLTSRSALRADGGGAVTVVAGSMTVSVAPFIAWVQGGVSVVQGGYPFVHDAAVTLAVAAGHASLSRTDTVVGVVRDNAFDGSGQVSASVAVIAGTPGQGAPALPTNCVPLRDITVPAGLSAGNGGLQAGNLGTDRRAYFGDWENYTPTWSGLVVNNGTVVARHLRQARTVHLFTRLLFGSGTAVGGGVAVSLPIPGTLGQILPAFIGASGGGALFQGTAYIVGATAQIFLPSSTGTSQLAQFGSFGLTLGANSHVAIQGTYEAAL